jgi:membrane-bound inhibitor of C-type lysozyme
MSNPFTRSFPRRREAIPSMDSRLRGNDAIMAKFAAACCLALAAALSAPAAHASEPVKKTVKAKAAKAPAKPAAPEEAEPDVADTITTDYNCELGNKITIYHNENDDSHIALRWKKRLHRLERVGTTTGAKRFENPLFGLIWIGIPSKGMLLDSKQNRQLANECKPADQEAKKS